MQGLKALRALCQVWMSDADAAWYCGLCENRADGMSGSVGLSEAYDQFMAFMNKQLCRLLVHGDHLNLMEALLLFLPHVSPARSA